MQVQVVHPESRFVEPANIERLGMPGMSAIDRITSAIVWLSYLGLISAGITVLTW